MNVEIVVPNLGACAPPFLRYLEKTSGVGGRISHPVGARDAIQAIPTPVTGSKRTCHVIGTYLFIPI